MPHVHNCIQQLLHLPCWHLLTHGGHCPQRVGHFLWLGVMPQANKSGNQLLHLLLLL
jgi:hypothetical protein